MLSLPPLEGLRFFEAAARHESFKDAAAELGVTPAAVAYWIRALEQHLDAELFDRHQQGVHLNRHGRAYPERRETDPRRRPQRHRASPPPAPSRPGRLRRSRRRKMADPQARHPRNGPPRHHDRTGNRPPRRRCRPPGLRRLDRLHRRDRGAPPDQPARGHPPRRNPLPGAAPPGLQPRPAQSARPPQNPAELHEWPLLYDLGWDSDWAYWASRQNQPAPDLTRASGFRLYSILIDAATQGLGAAIGRTTLIERELQHRTLVPALQHQEDAPERCCLITTEASRQRPEVQALRQWLLQQTQTDSQPVNHPNP